MDEPRRRVSPAIVTVVAADASGSPSLLNIHLPSEFSFPLAVLSFSSYLGMGLGDNDQLDCIEVKFPRKLKRHAANLQNAIACVP